MSKSILRNWFSILHVDYVKLNHHWNYKGIISPYYRLYYIDSGEGSVSDGEQNLKLEPGFIYLIPSFTLCNLNCVSNLGQFFIQFFEESADGISLFQNNRCAMKVPACDSDIKNFKQLLAINPGRGINRSDNPKVYEKNIYYKEYQELNNQTHAAKNLETQGIILQLLSRFLGPETFKNPKESPIPSKILAAMSYVQINLKNNLSVIDLAQRANQHPDYFSRQFLKHTGERPNSFINSKRIERAQYLITTTAMSYAEIAPETGFESLPYFSRMFKKTTGLTPGAYRERINGI
ncbi:AraC family transcriptional regulator [Pedobacter frigidisoli]|uniref:AraC family transcriptional regulator n=1 Tax=Pedobacter frigidisoli TaxID=2530455 RepID=A0A4R0P192_9SPHI|nr:AraC family transcriptional regulator [Pedobacter frigidisoli]TCD10514.1 AraC family transcriptional regulator [Pedobacter frigidisoli]